jgi:hypothetical protein
MACSFSAFFGHVRHRLLSANNGQPSCRALLVLNHALSQRAK